MSRTEILSAERSQGYFGARIDFGNIVDSNEEPDSS